MRRVRRSVGVIAFTVLSACGSGGAARVFIVRHDQPPNGAPAPGKSTDSTTPGPIRPACELVSRDEVAATLGNAVTAAVGQGPNCFWGTAVDGGTSATVTAVKPGPAKAADACAGLRLGQPTEAKHEPVTGVGSSAVWAWQPLTTLIQGSLVACWADSAVLVLLTGEHDQAAMRSTATALAQKVHTRS
jgi:hypothetical protein